MRPTLRTFWLFLGAVPLALLLIMAGGGVGTVIALYLAFVASLVLLDMAACPPPGKLLFSLEEPGHLYLGEPGKLTVRAERRDGRTAPAVEVAIEVNDKINQAAQEPVTIEPGALEATIELEPLSRGTARIPRAWFRWAGPLGLVRRQSLETPDLSLAVMPNFLRAATAAEELMGAASLDLGQRPHPRQGDGSEFSSLRDYAAGLDPRTIDWKRSARYRGLLAKEFEAERNHQIVLAFDTGHLMNERLDGLTRLDHMVNAGLVIAHAAITGGDRIGLFAFDSQVRSFVRPVGGMPSFSYLQHHMASFECSDTETNYTLAMTRLASQLTRRTLVILFTDFVDTTTAELMRENLSRLAVRHLVVFVALKDPYLSTVVDAAADTVRDISRAATAGELLKERQLLFNRLRRAGVLCLEPASAGLVSAMLRQYRTIISGELV